MSATKAVHDWIEKKSRTFSREDAETRKLFQSVSVVDRFAANCKLRRISILMQCIAIILFAGCSKEFHLTGISTGCKFSQKGLMIDKSLSYTFDYKKQGTFRDLCNFIYFEGDTVCFSFDFNQDIDGTAKVYFVDTVTKKRVLAERIEILRSRVYGFSLAGSLLEHFNTSRLGNPVPKQDREIKQPFILRIELERQGKKYSEERAVEFVVKY
jgi:hypothetical protein